MGKKSKKTSKTGNKKKQVENSLKVEKKEEQAEEALDTTESNAPEENTGVTEIIIEDTSEAKKKFSKAKIALLCVAGFILAVYIGGIVYFTDRFMYGTVINGIPAGFATEKTMETRINEAAKDYVLKVVSDGKVVDKISGEDIFLCANPQNGEITDFLASQKPYEWPYKLFYPDEFIGDNIVTYNYGQLKHQANNLNCVNNPKAKESKDATYKFKDDKFVIVDEVYGNKVYANQFCEEVKPHILRLERKVDLLKDDISEQPRIKKDDKGLVTIVSKMNDVLDAKIVYEEGFELPNEAKARFIVVSDNNKISFDEEEIAKYVEQLAEDYNTVGKDRKFQTSYGEEVVISKGNYGWKIDNEAEAQQILKDLKKGEDVEREMKYSVTAASHGENDFGDSYVEVNLSKQHMFLYVKGKQILDSDFVSGNLAAGHGTHTGTYKITYCARNAVLRGPDYATPVSYWMPFNGGEGLHDATWRGSFGGNIFRTSGSHGCVNLPFNVAKTLYSHVEAGFPVIVYSYGDTNNTYHPTGARVAAKIDSIGEVTPEKAGLIANIRAEYNGLPDGEKANVHNLYVLEWAEGAIWNFQNGM